MAKYPSHRRAGSFDRVPTPELLRYAEELGVTVPEGISKRGLQLLCKKAKGTLIRRSFEERGIRTGSRIRSRISGSTYDVLEVDFTKGQVKVFSDAHQRRNWLSTGSVFRNYQVI